MLYCAMMKDHRTSKKPMSKLDFSRAEAVRLNDSKPRRPRPPEDKRRAPRATMQKLGVFILDGPSQIDILGRIGGSYAHVRSQRAAVS